MTTATAAKRCCGTCKWYDGFYCTCTDARAVKAGQLPAGQHYSRDGKHILTRDMHDDDGHTCLCWDEDECPE